MLYGIFWHHAPGCIASPGKHKKNTSPYQGTDHQDSEPAARPPRDKKAFSRDTPFLRSSASADILVRGSAGMRCPALGDDNTCLIYAHRPFLCRIFGPTVRGKRRTVLLEGCGHFSKDISESDFPILSIYRDEDMLLRSLFAVAGRKRLRHIETIIPAALVLDLGKWL
jgi:Fe-S-cluster containining protein